MNRPAEENLNPLARALNAQLEESAPAILELLPGPGRRIYLPKALPSQLAPATKKRARVNATMCTAIARAGALDPTCLAAQLPPSRLWPP